VTIVNYVPLSCNKFKRNLFIYFSGIAYNYYYYCYLTVPIQCLSLWQIISLLRSPSNIYYLDNGGSHLIGKGKHICYC